MHKSKQAKAREFSHNARKNIIERDNGDCIFCRMSYHLEDLEWNEMSMKSIMHYIPRAQGGPGIEQNGAVGCQGHHHMFDNGAKGRRDEMRGLFKWYLQERYPDWNEDKLKYSKWGFLKGE